MIFDTVEELIIFIIVSGIALSMIAYSVVYGISKLLKIIANISFLFSIGLLVFSLGDLIFGGKYFILLLLSATVFGVIGFSIEVIISKLDKKRNIL